MYSVTITITDPETNVVTTNTTWAPKGLISGISSPHTDHEQNNLQQNIATTFTNAYIRAEKGLP